MIVIRYLAGQEKGFFMPVFQVDLQIGPQKKNSRKILNCKNLVKESEGGYNHDN